MGQMYFDAWAFDDSQGTALGELTEATDKHIHVVHNGIGNGQFSINRNSSQYAWAATDNIVRVRIETGGPFGYDDERYKFAFIIEEGSDTLLSTDEDGGETVTRGGRDLAVLLQRAVIWPTPNHPDNDIYWARALKDGVVRFNAANFAQGGRSAGAVLRTFIRDAEARSPNPLDPMVDDFSYGLDSNGDSWIETDTDWEFPVGDTYLAVLEKLVSSGLYYQVTAAPVIRAWEESQGQDLSATIDFTEGDNIREIADRTVHASPAVSIVVVKGTKNTDELKFREVEDAAVETALGGRREGYTEYTATPTNARLDLAGHKYIDKLKNQHDGPTSLGALDTTGREALVDYFPGDIVTVDIPGVWDELAVPISAISLNDTESGEYDPVVDFLEIPWDGQDTNSVGEGTDDGGGGGSGNCRDCPPLEPYVPGDDTPIDTPVPCSDGTPGMAAASFYPLGNGTGGNAAATPSPGFVHYFRPGVGEPSCPTTSGVNSWHFATFGAGGPGTTDTAGRNSGNELHIRVQGPGTITLDAETTGDTAATWALIHTISGVDTTDDSGSGVPSSVVVPDDGQCCHRLEVRVGAGTSGGFDFHGGTWDPDVTSVTPPITPPVPGQQGNEAIPGVAAGVPLVTNYPYVPGTLTVTVDGLAVTPEEVQPGPGADVSIQTSAASDDIIDATAHGFVAGDVVVFTALTGGTGLTVGQFYYVIATSLTADDFMVSATPGGSAVNFTTDITAGTVRKSGGVFTLVGDTTGKDVVVHYTIASATGTGAENPPPDPDAPTAGSTLTVEDGTTSVSPVDTVVFDGATVTDDGGGQVTVAIETGAAGEGHTTFAIGPFHISNLPATATTQALFMFAGAALGGSSQSEARMLAAGRVVGIIMNSNESRTSGTATARVRIAGTGTDFDGGSVVLDASSTVRDSAFVARSAGVAFAAATAIGVEVVTSGWAPTSADLSIWLVVSLDAVEDITTAAVAPTSGDDTTGGFGVGSRWIDTVLDVLWTCIDNTAGAAVWVPTVKGVNTTDHASNFAASGTSLAVTTAAFADGSVIWCAVMSSGRGANSITQTNVTWTKAYGGNGNSQFGELWRGVVAGGASGTTATIAFTGSNSSSAEVFRFEEGAFATAAANSTNTSAGSATVTHGINNVTMGGTYLWIVAAAAPTSSYGALNMAWRPGAIAFGGQGRLWFIRPDIEAFLGWQIQSSSTAWFSALVRVIP
jgi:hypothetical protein